MSVLDVRVEASNGHCCSGKSKLEIKISVISNSTRLDKITTGMIVAGEEDPALRF